MTWVDRDTVCVVTGGSAGIGLETARGLASLGARVVILGRDAARTAAVAEELARTTDNPRVSSEVADFSSLADVRRVADKLLAELAALHLLVNNAGLWHPTRVLSRDGFEDTFAVNHLAPFLLTNLLLERMRQSAPGRIVHVSSKMHAGVPGIDFDDLHAERRYRRKGLAAYSQSKLANLLFSAELTRRLEGSGVTSNAVHPGSVATSVTRGSLLARVGQVVIAPFLKTPAQGAATTLFVATSDELAGVSGRYYADCREAEPSAAAKDAAAARRLWEVSAELTGLG